MNNNFMTNAIEIYFKKYQSGEISSTRLEESVASILSDEKAEKFITEEKRKEYVERINKIRVKEQAKKDKKLAKISNVKKYSTFKKGLVAGFTLCTLTGTLIAASFGCSNSKEEKEVTPVELEQPVAKKIPHVEAVATKESVEKKVEEKVISSSLAFDPNDNKELVERMTNFVVDSLNSGIAIKDFMTEEEIENAKKADATSIITLEQLMDYYFVLNIEDIDPEDYARLGYKTKTTDTIIENYQNVANEYAMDLLTIDYSNLIDYSEIVAHKDSAKAINDINNLMAKLNVSTDKQEIIEETREYINTNYITNEANIYSMPSNELVYRSMFSFDILTNGKGITKDMGIILMEDGTYTCEKASKEGIKNESERAQEATNIRSIVEDKLEESRKYYSQDLTNISEYELKTGVELENEIREKALEKNAVYVANPTYKTKEIEVEKATTSKTDSKTNNQATQQQSTVVPANPSNVIGDNGKPIDNSEFEKYNIDPADPNAKANYEQSVEIATQQQFASSSEHVIKSNEGEAVVSGNDVNTVEYNNGYANGYVDGNNKQPINANGSASYNAGYNLGYVAGSKDREAIDKQYENLKPETHYEPVYNTPEEVISETVTEQGYTSDVSNYGDKNVTVDYNYGNTVTESNTNSSSTSSSTSNSSSSNEVVVKTEFVPVEDGAEEIIEESVTEETYTNDGVSATSETVELQENNAPQTIEVKELKRETTLTNDTNAIQLKYLNALKSLINESSKIVEETEEILNNRVR